MNYKGKLYGKIGKTVIPLKMTSNDVDQLQKDHDDLKLNYVALCTRLQECVQKHRIGLGGEKLDQLVVTYIDRLTTALQRLQAALEEASCVATCRTDPVSLPIWAVAPTAVDGHSSFLIPGRV
jgi:dihydroneopterin aldolase